MSERYNKEKRSKCHGDIFRDIVALLFPFLSIIGSLIAIYCLYKGYYG